MPEPGNYNQVNFAAASLGIPKYGFGSESKFKTRQNTSPGPGNYETPITLGPKAGVPVYSMPGRRKDLRPKTGVDVPGADAYSPSHTLAK